MGAAKNCTVRLYASNIQGSGDMRKLHALAARASGADFVIFNEVNKRPGDESTFAPLRLAAGLITNTPSSGAGPGFGSFLGSSSWNPETDYAVVDPVFEIGSISRLFHGVRVTVIGVYRSPNMKNHDDIEKFYDRVRFFVREAKDRLDDCVFIVGDDNSPTTTGSSYAKNAFLHLESIRMEFEGEHIIKTGTRKGLTGIWHQPDHVVAFYDRMRFKVTGLKPTKGVADHCELHIQLELKVGQLKVPKQKWFDRNFIISEGNWKEITNDLELTLRTITVDAIDTKQYWCQEDLDYLVALFQNKVNFVRLKHRVVETRKMPVDRYQSATPEERAVQFELNKIFSFERALHEKPGCVDLKRKLENHKKEYRKKCLEAMKKSLGHQIKNMRDNHKVDSARFFKESGRYMKFEGMNTLLPKQKIAEKLSAAEENYLRKGPEFTLSDLDDIVPVKIFDMAPDVSKTIDIVKSLKKVDTFFKRYISVLAPALTAILHAVNVSHLFPSACKIAKLTFLSNRTIFSLDFLSKFVEKAIQNAMDEVLPADKHGQFAYHKNRSCELNVAIGLDRVERYGYPCVTLGLDSRKAFDTCPFKQTAQVLHERCGAGELWYNYTKGRNYKFRGKLGFQKEPMGRGAPPGSILAPKAFAAFQTTDTEMTLMNSTSWLLWNGLFSDDKGPIATLDAVADGCFQNALDSTSAWADENYVDYHLSGKKGPKYFVFRQKDKKFDPKITENLYLHRLSDIDGKKTRVERSYENWQLGFCQVFPKDDEESNAYGYKLDWLASREGKPTLIRMAHRFDQVKYSWEPDWTRVCVRSYLQSKIQYGSALYWLRSDKETIEKVRYYYAMGLAACMGLEAAEVVSVNCAARQRVSSSVTGFIKACQFLNMPTLEDLAIQNAQHIIRQWAIYEPGRFVFNSQSKPCGLVDELENGLLADMWKLSQKPINDWYPEFNSRKENPEQLAKLAHEDRKLFPLYKQFYSGAVVANSHIFDGEATPTQEENVNTYIMLCRNHFKVLEESHRRKKRLGLQGKIGYAKKRCRKPGHDNANAKKVRLGNSLRCSDRHPSRPGRKRKLPCRLCGYAIASISRKIELVCCGASTHFDCFVSSSGVNPDNDNSVERICSKLRHCLEKGQKTVFSSVKSQRLATAVQSQPLATPTRVSSRETASQPCGNKHPPVACRYGCGEMIEIGDSRHYMYDYSALNCLYDPGGDVDYSRVTPQAHRAASMTRIRPLFWYQFRRLEK